MSQPSEAALRELGHSATAVGYLNKYLEMVEREEQVKLHNMSEAALFDEARRNAALAQYGRLEFVREFRRQLAPYVASHEQQYTR